MKMTCICAALLKNLIGLCVKRTDPRSPLMLKHPFSRNTAG